MNKNTDQSPNDPKQGPHKRCALCSIRKPLNEFICITKPNNSKKFYGTVCSICLGIDQSKFNLHALHKKLKKLFGKTTSNASLFTKKNNSEPKEEDEGGSGGKQFKKSRDVETLARELELSFEKFQLEQENQKDRKSKEAHQQHYRDLTKQAEELAKKADEERQAEENTDYEQEGTQKQSKEKSKHDQQKHDHDETDAIAGKIQRDHLGARRLERAAKLGGLAFSFAKKSAALTGGKNYFSRHGYSNDSPYHSDYDHNDGPEESADTEDKLEKQGLDKERNEEQNHKKTELQKLASLLHHKQQHMANNNAPAPASLSNKVGASPSEAHANMFSHKISGQEATAQQQEAQESQSAEANQRVKEELAAAYKATQARWGK